MGYIENDPRQKIQAERLSNQIRDSLVSACNDLISFCEIKGWRHLGFRSLETWAASIGLSRRTAYRRLDEAGAIAAIARAVNVDPGTVVVQPALTGREVAAVKADPTIAAAAAARAATRPMFADDPVKATAAEVKAVVAEQPRPTPTPRPQPTVKPPVDHEQWARRISTLRGVRASLGTAGEAPPQEWIDELLLTAHTIQTWAEARVAARV